MEALKCQSLILKVSSRCNLNCDYCYVYNAGDNTYLSQPKVMNDDVVMALLDKVKLHTKRFEITEFGFVFHGGEPLLIPKDFYKRFVETANNLLPDLKLQFSLQTNGILLDPEWCELLQDLKISIGVSIDGTPEIHNYHRKYHNGKDSYSDTLRGFNLIQDFPGLRKHLGCLMVIDINSDPIAVYQHLDSLNVSSINLLLPYGNFDKPPLGLDAKDRRNLSTPYADWLIAVFDKWFSDKNTKMSIRIFEQLIELILGIDNGFEYWGQRKNEFLVIETDGSIEPVGALKFCGEGFTKAGVNVLTDSLEEALALPLIRKYNQAHEYLCDTCNKCLLVDVCGGGFFPHRYSAKNKFDNPSIYCYDLAKLIIHIQNNVIGDLPEWWQDESQLERLNFFEFEKTLMRI